MVHIFFRRGHLAALIVTFYVEFIEPPDKLEFCFCLCSFADANSSVCQILAGLAWTGPSQHQLLCPRCSLWAVLERFHYQELRCISADLELDLCLAVSGWDLFIDTTEVKIMHGDFRCWYFVVMLWKTIALYHGGLFCRSLIDWRYYQSTHSTPIPDLPFSSACWKVILPLRTFGFQLVWQI